MSVSSPFSDVSVFMLNYYFVCCFLQASKTGANSTGSYGKLHSVKNEVSLLFGVGFGFLIFILVGIITESPNKIHSPLLRFENMLTIPLIESGNKLFT